MGPPVIYGEWRVKYTYTDALGVDTVGLTVGNGFATQDTRCLFVPNPYMILLRPIPAGVWNVWTDDPVNVPYAANVWHTVQWVHTPTVDEYIIDGQSNGGISPDLQAAYEAQIAANQSGWMWFATQGSKLLAFDNTVTTVFEYIKLGTYAGANDILDYQPLLDGFGPFTSVVGEVQITPEGLQCGPPDGPGGILDQPNGVTFNLNNPWPPTFTFHCSFSVGVTRNITTFSNLPPPDDIQLVQAALPETLLSAGYRIEFGAYHPDGTPVARSAVQDGTVALVNLQEPEDEQ